MSHVFPTWNAAYSLKLLCDFTQAVKADKVFSEASLKKLHSMGTSFYRQAINPQYISLLSGEQHLQLERSYADLADWVRDTRKTTSNNPKAIIIAQVLF